MKKLTIVSIFLFCSLITFAQNGDNVLRISRTSLYGTARSTAMGGAFGALGGDLSAIHVNPGGIGVFRLSEFNFTPYLDFDKTTSGMEMDKTSFLIGNIGVVATYNIPRSNWKNFNFGVNYTNLNNFNRNTSQYGGVNPNSSITDIWRLWANGNIRDELNEFTTSLAYDAYLLNLTGGATDDYMTPLSDDDQVGQEKYIKERGYQGEYALSLGGNYNDQLYLGVTIGLQNLHYDYYSEYQERNADNSTPVPAVGFRMRNLYFDEYFNSNGTGINFKAGAIYRPVPEIRFGLAIHSPTYYTISAYAENGIYASYYMPPPGDDRFNFGNNAYTEYDYRLNTPWRFIASAATILAKRAIISMDYEYVDYTSAKLKDSYRGEYDGVHDFLAYNAQETHNFRVGAELRANSFLSLRGGYAYWASPYAKGDWKEKNHIQTISGGIGLNFGNFYTDVAYLHKSSKDKDYFYNEYFSEYDATFVSAEIDTNYKNHEFRVSLGIKF